MTSLRRLFAAAFALLLVLPALPVGVGPVLAQDGATTYFVPETQQLITEPFLTAWTDLGGSERLGMPVSTVDTASAEATQYFERGALRVDSDGDVAAVPAGGMLLEGPDPSDSMRTGRRSPAPRESHAFTALRGAPSGESVAFDAESGHAVKGGMLRAYEASGGEEMLGAPLSEAYRSGDMRVQWFEMGRIDSRGGQAEMGPVGVELALLDGVDLAPKDRGTFATLNGPGPDTGPDLASGPDPASGSDLGPGQTGVASAAGTSFAPTRISIPAIGVDAYIETVGIVDGAMQVPSDPWNVGWYSGLGGPGGNTVMAAHKDWYGIGPVVFWSLGALGPGNEIYLYDGAGNAATYVVYDSTLVDAYTDSGSIIGDQGGDTLTLITCGGDFNGSMYNLRVIVRASRAA